ncbi:MAG: hypothetical protein ACJZ59_07860 [Candidatus Thalassarchaeaceae archaeon]
MSQRHHTASTGSKLRLETQRSPRTTTAQSPSRSSTSREADQVLDTGGAEEEETPGFGAVVGLGGLAAAAWMRGGREDDE